MANYRLSAKASQDLAEIFDYTWDNFGETQAQKYLADLKECLDILAENPLIAPERNEFKPPVRIFPSGGHLIIFKVEKSCILVIRFIHKNMELTRHL